MKRLSKGTGAPPDVVEVAGCSRRVMIEDPLDRSLKRAPVAPYRNCSQRRERWETPGNDCRWFRPGNRVVYAQVHRWIPRVTLWVRLGSDAV